MVSKRLARSLGQSRRGVGDIDKIGTISFHINIGLVVSVHVHKLHIVLLQFSCRSCMELSDEVAFEVFTEQ